MAGPIIDADEWLANSLAESVPGGEYETGIQKTTKSWHQNTIDAIPLWTAEAQSNEIATRWRAGIRDVTTAEWRQRTLAKGNLTKWTSKINGAVAKYEKNFTPYANRIATTLASPTYPKRGRRGDPSNETRCNQIAEALHQLKATGG